MYILIGGEVVRIKGLVRFIVIGVVTVPIFLVYYTCLSIASYNSSQSYIKSITAAADTQQVAVGRLFSSMAEQVKRVTQNANISELVSSSTDRSVFSRVSAPQVFELNSANESVAYSAVADLDGVVLYSTGDITNGEKLEDFEAIKEVIIGEPHFSSLSATESGRQYIAITDKLVDENDKLTGYYSQAFYADELIGTLTELNAQSNTEVFILDNNQNIIGESRFIPDSDISSIPDKNKDFQSILYTAAHDNSAQKNFKLEGRNVFAYGKNLESPTWTFFASIEQDQLSKFSDNMVSLVLHIIVPGIAIAIILAFHLSKRITVPLDRLKQTLTSIQNGNRDARFFNAQQNEFGEIAEAFNTLMDEVVISEERHRTISEISDSMLLDYDFNTQKIYISDNFKKKFGADFEHISPTVEYYTSFIHSADALGFAREVRNAIDNCGQIESQYRIRNANGDYIWTSLSLICTTNRTGVRQHLLIVVVDIDSEKKLELQLAERATFDFLSQLYNRSTFEKALVNELDTVKKARGELAITFVDIDDFKNVNDKYNHACGDEVIKFVADTIKKFTNGNGFAGRFGGDEFVMCIRGEKGKTGLLAERMKTTIEKMLAELCEGFYSEAAQAHMKVGCSVGIAIAPEHGQTLDEIFMAADDAMYYVKRHGKANYSLYSK